jgi:glycine/D-amino acid oxidase-like deaminating enzyme
MGKTGFIIAVAALTAIIASPATAQDRRVPADASGKLADFAGQPWYEPLAYCNAVWTSLGRMTEDEAERRTITHTAVAFRHRGSLRLAADRGWEQERAREAFGGRVDHHLFVMRRMEDRQSLLARTPGCQGVIESYDAANP